METSGLTASLPLDSASVAGLLSLRQPGGAASLTPEGLQQAAGEFESLFLSLVMKEMRNTLPEGAMFGGESSDVYGGLFDMMLSQSLAGTQPLGIARIMQSALQGLGSADSQSSGKGDEPGGLLPTLDLSL